MSEEERKFSVDGHVYRYGLVNGTRCWYTGYSCKVAVDDETERLLAALSTAEREREADALDAKRWRWFRQFLSVEDDAGEGGQYLFMADDRIPEATFLPGFEHTVEELVDLRARVPSGGEEGR